VEENLGRVITGGSGAPKRKLRDSAEEPET
jgi:hypothetical protein